MSSSDFAAPAGKRKRAPSAASRASRLVRALVDPINARTGTWQAESVRLAASMRRLRESGRTDAAVIATIEALADTVREEASAFDATVAGAGGELASSSRVADTRRALALVLERLAEAAQP